MCTLRLSSPPPPPSPLSLRSKSTFVTKFIGPTSDAIPHLDAGTDLSETISQVVRGICRGQAPLPAVAEAAAARRKELRDEKNRGRTGRRGKDEAAAAAAGGTTFISEGQGQAEEAEAALIVEEEHEQAQPANGQE